MGRRRRLFELLTAPQLPRASVVVPAGIPLMVLYVLFASMLQATNADWRRVAPRPVQQTGGAQRRSPSDGQHAVLQAIKVIRRARRDRESASYWLDPISAFSLWACAEVGNAAGCCG